MRALPVGRQRPSSQNTCSCSMCPSRAFTRQRPRARRPRSIPRAIASSLRSWRLSAWIASCRRTLQRLPRGSTNQVRCTEKAHCHLQPSLSRSGSSAERRRRMNARDHRAGPFELEQAEHSLDRSLRARKHERGVPLCPERAHLGQDRSEACAVEERGLVEGRSRRVDGLRRSQPRSPPRTAAPRGGRARPGSPGTPRVPRSAGSSRSAAAQMV